MKKRYPFIYLASQSPRRMGILQKMKIPFKVISSSYQEKNIRRVVPEELVLRHAYGKLLKARVPRKARFILGADTIVWFSKEALGKPRTKMDAYHMLASLSGRMHEVYTALVLMDRRTGRLYTGYARTKVYFKALSKLMIEKYIARVYPYDKAGAYAIQEEPMIVRAYKGSYSNVVGLPIELLGQMLKVLA